MLSLFTVSVVGLDSDFRTMAVASPWFSSGGVVDSLECCLTVENLLEDLPLLHGLSGNDGASFQGDFGPLALSEQSELVSSVDGVVHTEALCVMDQLPMLDQLVWPQVITHPTESDLKSIPLPPSNQQVVLGVQQLDTHMAKPYASESSVCSVSLHTRVTDWCPDNSAEEMHQLYSCTSDELQASIVPVDLIQNRRPFKCSSPGCNKTFRNPQTLKMHNKTHCGQAMNYAHSLVTFPSIPKAGHNKKVPSKCPICKRTFVGLYELRRHFGRKHSQGEKMHSCNKCGKKFFIEVDLRDHEKQCGESLECKCGVKFAFKCNLVAHKKTHPWCQDSGNDSSRGLMLSGVNAQNAGRNSFNFSLRDE